MKSKETEALLVRLGIKWQNIYIYNVAMTHTSYANENRHLRLEHNQRLEFLGDAVLELLVSDYLYTNWQQYPEGLLTKTRAAVVCEPSLATVATSIELGNYLKIGKGEARSGGRQRPSLIADAFEALIGAIYLDSGLETTRNFVLSLLGEPLDEMAQKAGKIGDFKTELQELIQQKSDQPIVYAIIKEAGPDHDKTFTAAVSYNNEIYGKGSGRTKKEAEQSAAQKALQKINKKTE